MWAFAHRAAVFTHGVDKFCFNWIYYLRQGISIYKKVGICVRIYVDTKISYLNACLGKYCGYVYVRGGMLEGCVTGRTILYIITSLAYREPELHVTWDAAGRYDTIQTQHMPHTYIYVHCSNF